MLMPKTNGNKYSKQRGSTTLEMALVVTLVLFPLIFGIIDFSRALYAYHWVSGAAREATRWLSVRGANCTLLSGGCPVNTNAPVQTYVQSIKAPGIYSATCSIVAVPGCISTSTVWSGIGGDGLDCTNGGLIPTNSAGCTVSVTVNYTFPFTLPFIAGLTGTAKTFSSTSTTVIAN